MNKLLSLSLLLLTIAAAAQKPRLGLPNGHTDHVSGLLFSKDGALLVSSSYDKSLKLWDVHSGKLLKTSPHMSTTILGSLSASEDLRYVEYSRGWTDGRARVYDFNHPEQRDMLSEEFDGPPRYNRLAPPIKSPPGDVELPEGFELEDVSPDGKYLLLANSNSRVILYEHATQKTVRGYNLPGETEEENSFLTHPDNKISPDGTIIARGRGDGTIILQDLQTGQLIRRLESHTRPPVKLQFATEDSQLIWTTWEGKTRIWDFKSSRIIEQPQLPAEEQPLPQPADELPPINILGVSPDGKLGVSVERMDNDFGRYLLAELWGLPGLAPIKTLDQGPYTGQDLKQVIFSADQQRFLLFTDHELKDGTVAYVWDIPSGRMLYRYEEPSNSYTTAGALSADGSLLALGNWTHHIYLHDVNTGQRIHTFTGHKGEITGLAFSSDSKMMASGSTDGTVKLWDLTTRQEIATLLNIDEADWVVMSPNGLFDASQQAMNLLYYIIEDKGKQEVIELEQLKSRYYEPGLLQKLLAYSDERIRPVENLEAVKLYPKVQSRINQGVLQIELEERNGGIGKVSIFINGKEVAEDANPPGRGENARRASRINFDLRPFENYFLHHPDSTNIISIRAYNEEGWLKSPAIQLEYRVPAARSRGSGSSGGGSAQVGQLTPKLYVVSIGTSDYTGTKLDLRFADQDATMMARALESVGTALFTNGSGLEVHCLSTAQEGASGLAGTRIDWQFADKTNIEAIFRSIKQKARAEDVIVVYLSGHGVTYGGAEQAQFHYLTQGIASEDLSDAAIRKAYTISSDELTHWINDIPALKQVLIIDACNSGQIVENLTGGTKALNSSQIRALDRMKDRTGMFVLSGSASDKVSYEASEYGQGLLTYALLQGMLGVATRQTAEGNYIDVMKLFQHARDEVPRLAATINGIQTPMLGFPQTGDSFDIGIVDENANIPIGSKKPVMIRSNFLNQVTLKDDLGLVSLLEAEFRSETEKGKNADLIYVDVMKYPGAYALSGLYSITGTEIRTTIKLFKNGEDPMDLQIPPTDDPDRLVKLVLREVKRAIR
ncbi:WD40 domain-containing protein [Flavilitoribacter nigricans]|uniref:Peptidase C14 caspase domain-containing protein n=1 Tax=Flavilitoribacter nigricans (strain ATCC 23147 / DSM 23189 / NBRC 102662 / NCIMB 1420 / SS-2) TaxID=1122177 RepID=A0A2D0NH66_FLAN2|nr:caspase family protein [Flavilitoribacter nigricans]PHN07831.1 hypothetical protein CRP01_03515 [Flavilitoribacter nigricans DSM 23189 = NBRC 102662]